MDPTPITPATKPFCQEGLTGPAWWAYWYFTLFAVLSMVMGGGIGGCSSANRPTPSQCDSGYSIAVVACNAFVSKPDKQAQCLAAADAAHLVCLVWANTGTQDEARGAKTAGVTERKLAEVYDLVKDGKMSGDAAREYIFGKT